MKKNTLKNSIEGIKRVSSRIPKTINEALTYGENGGMYEDEDLLNGDEEEEPKHNDESGFDVMAFVDDIRKKSLKGMAQLADNPDDERYQLLKKIWQICDKKPEQQTAFGSHQQMDGQQKMQNNRPMN